MGKEDKTGYKLVWSEEFDSGAISESDWSWDLGNGHRGWGNNEAQLYTDKVQNCVVKDKKLVITAKKESDGSITSARIHTSGKHSWKYGYFECRCKIPSGKGTWPAVWFLSDGFHGEVSWPKCGEIDLLEHVGRRPGEVHFSLHSEEFNHRKNSQVTGVYQLPEVLEGFHTYAMEWTPEGFTFFVNDQEMGRFLKGEKSGEAQWPFDQSFFLLINLAIGGGFGGEIDDTALPAVLELDYIRVYQKV